MRVVIVLPTRRGPENYAVTCESGRQCTEVAKVEMRRPHNQREGAKVRIEGETAGGFWTPLVEWVYRGSWAKELR